MCADSNYPIALIGAGSAILGAIAGAMITSRMLYLREYKTAVGQLHAAFAAALDSLHEGDKSRSIKDSIERHEAAMATFRTYLSGDRRRRFDLARDEYRRLRRPVLVDEVISGGYSNASARLASAIEKIMEIAEEPSHSVFEPLHSLEWL